MKILFIGDISGQPGRETVGKILPEIKAKHQPDLVIANCENSAHGKGVTREGLQELIGYGVDFFTGGDHIWDQKEFRDDLYDLNLPVVRAYNYERSELLPGKPYDIVDLGPKGKIVVAQFLGNAFMREPVRNPFWAAEDFLNELRSKGIQFPQDKIIIDIHAEATAEKISFGYHLKDKVTAVLGTHTHVATADARIIGEGTAYVTDVGMVGPLDASLWASLDNAIHNFKYPYKVKMEMEENGRRIFNSVLIEIQDSGTTIHRIDKVLV